MAKFKAKETTFYDGRLIPAGEVFDYVGEPGDNLEPVDDAARAMFEEAAARRRVEAQRLARGAVSEGVAVDSSALELKVEQAVGRVNAVEASAKAAADKAVADISELDAAVAALVAKVNGIAAELAAVKALGDAPAPAPAPEPAPEPAPPPAPEPTPEPAPEPAPVEPPPAEQPQ